MVPVTPTWPSGRQSRRDRLSTESMVSQWLPEKPAGAWWPHQVIEFLVEALRAGDFYILCPDNDADRPTDNKRMAWAMGDLIENRPALSRWHQAYAEAFEAHLKG